MAQDVCVAVRAGDRARLAAIAADRSRPQKHLQRARTVLLPADRLTLAEVARRAGVSRPAVWRRQARYAQAGVDGLLHDKTRPPGRAPVPTGTVAKVLALTCSEPLGQATHWTGRAMAQGEVEDEPQHEHQLDRRIRIPRLAAGRGPPRGLPSGLGGLVHPGRRVAAPLRPGLVPPPVPDPVPGLRDTVAASGVVLERHARERSGPAADRCIGTTSGGSLHQRRCLSRSCCPARSGGSPGRRTSARRAARAAGSRTRR